MATHPDSDLVPYLRGELPPAERERVARHLEECPDCKQDTEVLRELIDNVARVIGEPPPVNWARYRAELAAGLVAASDAAGAVGEPRECPLAGRGVGRAPGVEER